MFPLKISLDRPRRDVQTRIVFSHVMSFHGLAKISAHRSIGSDSPAREELLVPVIDISDGIGLELVYSFSHL